MARQLEQYPARIVHEDVRCLEEFCRARSHQFVYYGPHVFTVRMPAAATSNHTAQFYGGAEGESAISSDKVAEQYGGIMMTDHNRGRKIYGGRFN